MPVTIRSRLLLLVLAVLLPGLLGVAWLIGSTFKAEQEAHGRALGETARALSQVVASELTQRAVVARVLAQSSALDDGAAISDSRLRSFDALARRALRGLDGWIELRAPGQLLLDSRWPAGDPLSSPVPARLYETPQVLPLQAGEGREAHASVVEPVVRSGQTVLNLVLTLRPAELQRIIDRQRLPPEWVGTVLDSRATVVARHPGGVAQAGRSATPDVVERVALRQDGLIESVSLDGVHTVAYLSTVDSGWSFITAMPRARFMGQMSSAVLHVALVALTLVTLAVAGALWLARRIVVPVQALKTAATRLQQGESVPLSNTGIVECDEVGLALSHASNTLRQGRQELERQVTQAVELTRHAEQRVAQSQRVEALGRLTGGVAHDFNNLLGVISNSAHLIQRMAPGPELQVPVAATLRAVEVGSRLTQHLLRFAGQRAVRPRRIALNSYLPDLEELLRSVLGGKITIDLHVAADIRPVYADDNELELALINLSLNARDAMAEGGVLKLHARNADASETEGLAPKVWVVILVGDDGPGMARDVASRVFEPFFTTKPVGKGTGLGLSQVHGFCVQAGGDARIASAPGLGTTVQMLLPAQPDDTDAPTAEGTRPAPTASDAPVQGSASLAGARVLLVEDNDELGEVTSALLQLHGATVERAADAIAALRLLDTRPAVDVVLTDVVMPGPLDGVGLARQVRRERPELPVLLISGYVASEAAVRDFVLLRKPCAPEDLVAALATALEGRARR
ncbi:MAG: response regulator [Rubrivivax sp.]|nr:response regulator [Rubrivivax sp.]